MRDRLIELLDVIIHSSMKTLGEIADILLANGVIAPPCKVGDMVYFINRYNHIMLYKDRVYEASVSRIVVTKFGVSVVIQIHGGHAVNEIPYVEFGKDFFLTREEAEQALKGDHQ